MRTCDVRTIDLDWCEGEERLPPVEEAGYCRGHQSLCSHRGPPVTVGVHGSWFYRQKRGYWLVRTVRHRLAASNASLTLSPICGMYQPSYRASR